MIAPFNDFSLKLPEANKAPGYFLFAQSSQMLAQHSTQRKSANIRYEGESVSFAVFCTYLLFQEFLRPFERRPKAGGNTVSFWPPLRLE